MAVVWLFEMEKYYTFLESENKALALCAVVRQSEQLKEKETMTFDEFLQNYFIEIQPRLYKNIKEGYVRDKTELWFYYKNLDISL